MVHEGGASLRHLFCWPFTFIELAKYIAYFLCRFV